MNFTIKPLLITAMCIAGLTAVSQVTLTATSGTASANYSTFSAAIAAVNNGTHKGNIVIKIHANITETANTTLNGSGTGSASYASIKIRPADTATVEKVLSISTTSVPVLTLTGVKNLIIDGRPNETGANKLLTISNPNNLASSHGILFTGGATDNVVRYCNIKSASVGSIATSVIRFTTGANSNNSILNCRIDGGNLGLEINGTNGTPNNYLIVSNNLFIDQKATGIRLAAGVGNINISNNSFTHDVGTTTGGYQCINTSAIESSDTVMFTSNKAYNIKTNAANFIHGIFLSPSVASGLFVARNNSFILGSAANPNSLSQVIRGVLFTGTLTAGLILEHNTFRIGGLHVTANGNPTSVGVLKSNSNASSVFTMQNNLCINTRTGTANAHIGVYISSPTTGINTIDYNTYIGSPTHAMWLTTRYDTLSNYRSAAAPYERHSQFGSVNFINESDPDVATNNVDSLMYGIPIAEVPTDIYGVTRSATQPFRGAHEGTLVTLPVKISSFNADKTNTDVKVTWKLETKTDALGTTVQRSEDGIKFIPVATVAYNENGKYAFTDAGAFGNGNSVLYYRLMITQANGTFTYSSIKKVTGEKSGALALAVLNNPVSGILKVNIQSTTNENAVITVRNASGVSVITTRCLIKQGINVLEIDGSSKLAPGFYTVTATQRKTQKSVKFLKQ